MTSIDKPLLISAARGLGADIDDARADTLDAFFRLVVEENEKFNLTAVTDAAAFTEKHLIDSLSAAALLPVGCRVLDIGAGAGFPSFPLAVARPDARITALDSTEKKMRFLEEAARSLGITNLSATAGRAEELSALRSSFDVVTARAVASLPVLCELALPLLKTGGLFVAYKTDESETDSAQRALRVLGGTLQSVQKYNLPSGDSRALVVIRKTSATPKEYPRRYAKIKASPL